MRDAEQQRLLNQRVEQISWATFLILLGALLVIPGRLIPGGVWLLAAGLAIFGLIAARYRLALPISWFSMVLGLLALAAGLAAITGLDLPLFPVLLILAGLAVILPRILEPDRG